MKHLLIIVYILFSLSHSTVAQKATPTPIPCALNCFDQHPFIQACPTDDADCLCADEYFQKTLTACVISNCTIRESFLTHSITGNLCGWPYRDRSAKFRNVCLFLLTVVTLFVGARIVARLPMFRGPMGPDDYLILIIWILLISHLSLVWKASDSSLKRDIRTVPMNKITLTLQYFSALEWIYYMVIWLTKISILLLYLRLFPNEEFRRLVKVGLVICSVAGTAFLCASIFQCFPGWAGIIINIFADIAVLTLPLPTIWKLNLELEKRLSTMAMFGVGLFVTIVSIVRVTQYARIGDSFNETWGLDEPGLWSALEMYVGVVCACMPGMRSFYTRVLPSKKLAELTTSWRRSKVTDTRPTSTNYTIGSKGRRVGSHPRDHGIELSLATEDFEDPRLWQEEFERERANTLVVPV